MATEFLVPKPQPYRLREVLETLTVVNPGHGNPDSPYAGVQALFNADLHTCNPNWAPREDWVIVSPYVIELAESSVDHKHAKLKSSYL